MQQWYERYVNKFYRSRPGWLDGTTQFHNLCRSYCRKNSSIILEIGPGASNKTSEFLSQISGQLCGLDIDNSIYENRFLSKAYVYDEKNFPFPANNFDLVVSDYANEHIFNPEMHLAEIWRVLKNNGIYIFRTPNLYHYVSIVGRLTPHCFHKITSRILRKLPDEMHDPYPTYYRMNSSHSCVNLLKNKFCILELSLIEKEPSYARLSRLLFFFFLFYERIVNSTDFLVFLRANIICVAQKKISQV